MSALRKFLRSVILIFVSVTVLGAAGAAAAFYWWANAPMKLAQKETDITIRPRGTVRSVALELQQGGLPMNRRLFEVLTRYKGLSAALKSGNYDFQDGTTPYQVLQKVARGDVNQFVVTIIEGWNFAHMRAEINQNAQLDHDSLKMSDAELMSAIGEAGKAPEGLFFPDTYLFPKGTSDLDIYKRAFREAAQRLDEIWKNRAPNLPLQTPYDALTLASLVEKETGVSGERGEVAAVFVNRLRIGMPLQTDPSVIYGLTGQFSGHLRKKDLQTDTPYNTYTRNGLPPTPISLPGMASLQAATHPALTKALYFVARGDGTSIFSSSLEDHNRAVNQYQRKVEPHVADQPNSKESHDALAR